MEIINAVLKNLNINISNKEVSSTQRMESMSNKIMIINNNLRERKALWVAGITDFSKKSYEEKKAAFGGVLPDLGGAEYYIGGIFELNPDSDYSQTNTNSNYVNEFDWRNRHGVDWTTPWKDQGACGSCWAFSAVGAVESLVNLYYNHKLDLDLSEQQIVSCAPGSCSGGLPINALNYIVSNGIVNENCFKYTQTNSNCDSVCSIPYERIFISNTEAISPQIYANPLDTLKNKIIKKGILAGVVWGWGHAMSLVGYGAIKEGDTVFYANMSQNQSMDDITIGENDPRIGQTYFIFKNSTSWGHYFYVLADNMNQFSGTSIPMPPITSLNYTDADIICEDRDGDGYYNWGIGPKPPHCPPCAPDEPDGDDSNPNLGPMNEFGYCMPLAHPYFYPETTILTDTVWNSDHIICGNLIIQAGASLTINNNARITMGGLSRVIVASGGTLTLDSSKILNCNVRVQSGGKLIIKNNGVLDIRSTGMFEVERGGVFENSHGSIE